MEVFDVLGYNIFMNEENKLPYPPKLRNMIGPSIILLGLGLGSGELIVWPYLVSQYGLGIIWAAVVGITLQFFINLEIERYTLLKGESIFVGFARRWKFAPYWFIFSTFVAWFWPGIIATSAKIFTHLVRVDRFEYVGIIALILIGIILSSGRSLYKTVETFQKTIIIIGVPIIAIITFLIAKQSDYQALGQGLIGIGEGFRFLPRNIDLFIFLGALAYAGAGGNLNLAQSFYIKEKGYGMCKGTIGIKNVILGKEASVLLEGKEATESDHNNRHFFLWWRLVNKEHFLVFLFTGAFTILLVALLAYSTIFGSGIEKQGVNFLLEESKIINILVAPFVSVVFLFFVALMLFGTQLTVLDSTSRIIAENIVIVRKKINLSRAYYIIIWSQIVAGIAVFLIGYRDPISLVVLSAVINAGAMFVHIILTSILNRVTLPKVYQSVWWRQMIILLSIFIFGMLLVLSIIDPLFK